MTPNINPHDATAHIRKLDRATGAHEKTRRTLDEAIADARTDGLPLTTISEHTPYSREWARKIANRVDAEHCNAVGDAPNSLGTERCKLAAGHEGRHEDGIVSWPNRSVEPCGAPNYSDRCELPAGHEGRHRHGNMTWPQGVERPVDPANSAPTPPATEES